MVTTGANSLTLANGTESLIKNIVMKTDGGDGTLIPTSRSGYSSITFTAVGQTVRLMWTNSAWIIIGYYGVTIA